MSETLSPPTASAPVARPPAKASRRVAEKLAVPIAQVVFVLLFALLGKQLSAYYQYIFAIASVYALAVLGNNMLLAHIGLVSLGQGGLMAVGAYSCALAARGGMNTWVSLAVGAGAAVLAGSVIGLPALRLHGHYLGLVTLLFALAVSEVISVWHGVTGGDGGLAVATNVFSTDGQYAVTYAIVAIVLVAQTVAVRGRLGRVLHLVRDSERAAAATGIRVGGYKLAVFAYSGGLAGLAGGLLVSATTYLAPAIFSLNLSIYLFAAVVIGGRNSAAGAVVGALVVAMVPQLTTGTAGLAPLILGAALVAAVFGHHFLLPRALAAWSRVDPAAWLQQRLRRKPEERVADG